MQFILKKLLQILLASLATVPWKILLAEIYAKEIFPALQKRVADTTSQFDDVALTLVDKIAREFLSLPEVKLEHHRS